MLRVRGIQLVLLCAVASACANEKKAPAVDTLSPDVACKFSTSSCDVTEAKCQAELLALTACVRGDDTPPMPALRRISADELRSELRDQALAAEPMNTPVQAAMRALHLLAPDTSLVDASVEAAAMAWAAYYEPSSKSVTIIDGAGPANDIDAMYTLSHEFTHYLQDVAVDLHELSQGWQSSTDDRASLHALLEGDAVVTSARTMVRVMRRSPDSLDWGLFIDSLATGLLDDVAASKTPLQTATINLPYSAGAAYIASVWNRYDREHVDALFDEAPHSLIDWLLQYGIGMPAATVVEPLDCQPPLAPDGFTLYSLDSLGPSGALALLSAASHLSIGLASNLRNDAIAVYSSSDNTDPSAPVLAVWRLRFKSASSAQTFKTSIASLQLATEVDDREVTISVSSDAAQEPLQAEALQACPDPSQLKPLQQPATDTVAAIRKLLR